MTADELIDLVTQYGAARADSAYAARDGDERESVRRAGVALDALASIRDEVESKRDQLRDAANDLLDVRGILSPADGVPVTPLSLVPTVAPAVKWCVDEVARARADGLVALTMTPEAGRAFWKALVSTAGRIPQEARAKGDETSYAEWLEWGASRLDLALRVAFNAKEAADEH